jgi:hypothetical protein
MMLTKTVQTGHPRTGEEPMFRHYEYSTNNGKIIRIRIRNAKFLRMRIFVTNIRNECECIRYSCRPLTIGVT